MSNFKVLKIDNPEDSWDARQKLIEGWDADAIRNATVLVIGAGAIGNETIKNLALLGFGNTIICDLDTIETSNLTRTALFTEHDIGKKKAPLAAARMREMNLEPTAIADSFDGDVVYALGDGVFRRATLVLGCLDNVETRMHVNKICMRYGIPYIDAGIGALGCNLQVMKGHEYGCYACFAPAYKFEDRFRNSCDITKKKAATAGKAATVQTTSAIIAGLQVQEALKIVCDMSPEFGIELYYQGTFHSFDKFRMRVDPKCTCHQLSPRTDIRETPLSHHNTLRELLTYTSAQGFRELSILDDKLRDFIATVDCPACGKSMRIFRPLYQVYSNDFYCDDCRGSTHQLFERIDKYVDFSLETTPDEILDLTLEELGIPAFHVLPLYDPDSENYDRAYFELTGDLKQVLPNYYQKHKEH